MGRAHLGKAKMMQEGGGICHTFTRGSSYYIRECDGTKEIAKYCKRPSVLGLRRYRGPGAQEPGGPGAQEPGGPGDQEPRGPGIQTKEKEREVRGKRWGRKLAD